MVPLPWFIISVFLIFVFVWFWFWSLFLWKSCRNERFLHFKKICFSRLELLSILCTKEWLQLMALFCWLSTTVHGYRSSLFLCLNKSNYTFRFTQSVSAENLQVRDTYWYFILIKNYTLLLRINNSHFLCTSEGKFVCCVMNILFVFDVQVKLY